MLVNEDGVVVRRTGLLELKDGTTVPVHFDEKDNTPYIFREVVQAAKTEAPKIPDPSVGPPILMNSKPPIYQVVDPNPWRQVLTNEDGEPELVVLDSSQRLLCQVAPNPPKLRTTSTGESEKTTSSRKGLATTAAVPSRRDSDTPGYFRHTASSLLATKNSHILDSEIPTRHNRTPAKLLPFSAPVNQEKPKRRYENAHLVSALSNPRSHPVGRRVTSSDRDGYSRIRSSSSATGKPAAGNQRAFPGMSGLLSSARRGRMGTTGSSRKTMPLSKVSAEVAGGGGRGISATYKSRVRDAKRQQSLSPLAKKDLQARPPIREKRSSSFSRFLNGEADCYVGRNHVFSARDFPALTAYFEDESRVLAETLTMMVGDEKEKREKHQFQEESTIRKAIADKRYDVQQLASHLASLEKELKEAKAMNLAKKQATNEYLDRVMRNCGQRLAELTSQYRAVVEHAWPSYSPDQRMTHILRQGQTSSFALSQISKHIQQQTKKAMSPENLTDIRADEVVSTNSSNVANNTTCLDVERILKELEISEFGLHEKLETKNRAPDDSSSSANTTPPKSSSTSSSSFSSSGSSLAPDYRMKTKYYRHKRAPAPRPKSRKHQNTGQPNKRMSRESVASSSYCPKHQHHDHKRPATFRSPTICGHNFIDRASYLPKREQQIRLEDVLKNVQKRSKKSTTMMSSCCSRHPESVFA